MNKDPEERSGYKEIKDSKWFKDFYETDSSYEDKSTNIWNYDYSNDRIFKVFNLLKTNNFKISFFLRIYDEIMSKSDNDHDKTICMKKISEKNKIIYNFVESEIFSLTSSNTTMNKDIQKNTIKLTQDKEDQIFSAIKKNSAFENQNLGFMKVLAHLINICKSKFDQLDDEVERNQDLIVSKFHKQKISNQDFKLSDEDKLILQILEEMTDYGFHHKDIQLSLKSRKLDSIRSTFRLIASRILFNAN